MGLSPPVPFPPNDRCTPLAKYSLPPEDMPTADGLVTATLVRGRYFSYLDHEWSAEKGTLTRRVPPDVADYIRRTAIDVVGHLDGEHGPEPVEKPKFTFAEGSA